MLIQGLYPAAARHVDNMLKEWLPYQVLDKKSPDCGGWLSEDVGFCATDHMQTARLIRYMGYAYCCKHSQYYNDPAILERIVLAAQFQKRRQRPSGFIDLRERNYDSPPDTAFAIGAMASVIWMARYAEGVRDGARIEEALRPFVMSAAEAIADHGGFHTPNHRWIIVGALSLAEELYPELRLRAAIDEYLAEGIDLNEAGLYSEKSFLYSAHINDKLLCCYEAFGETQILEKIKQNCHGVIDMMNTDTTLLTNISIRQDNGRKVLPDQFLYCFYYIARTYDDARIWSAIAAVLQVADVCQPELVYLFARHPDWQEDIIEAEPLREDYEKLMLEAGIWKYKKGDMSISLMTGQTGPLSMQFGELSIPEVRIFAPYFAGAKYLGRELIQEKDGVTLTIRPDYDAEQGIHMPGYWRPLGRPVPFEDLPYHNLAQRTPTPRPNVSYTWRIVKKENGIDLYINSQGGIDHATFAVEFLLNLPGTVITESTLERVENNHAMLLTKGYLTYRCGRDAVTIGPGFYEHNAIDANIDPQKNILKVAMTDWIPVERKIEIRFYKMDGRDTEEYHSVIKESAED